MNKYNLTTTNLYFTREQAEKEQLNFVCYKRNLNNIYLCEENNCCSFCRSTKDFICNTNLEIVKAEIELLQMQERITQEVIRELEIERIEQENERRAI